jgi:hypothetical protein
MLLALDLGMRTGWALFSNGRRLASGTWILADRWRARGDVFLDLLLRTVAAQRIQVIAHEHVPSLHQHAGVNAAHLFGGWLELIEIVRMRTTISVVRINTSEAHAAAGLVRPPRTPKGLSPAARRRSQAERREEIKRRTVAAAQARGWPVKDDNEADACFVALAALAKGTGGQ